MRCPDDLRAALVDLIAYGLLKIRLAGWAGDATRCADVADFLHNLPAMLHEDRPHQLEAFWLHERSRFLERLEPDERSVWEDLLAPVGDHLLRLHSATASVSVEVR